MEYGRGYDGGVFGELEMKKLLSFILCLILLSCSVAYADAIQVPSPVSIPDEAVGVWQVPKLKTSSPLYIKRDGKSAQGIVDDYNSALLARYGVGQIIADHYGSRIGNDKNLWQLERINVDDIAWFITETETVTYVCYMTCVADVCGGYYKINGTTILPYFPEDIICSCCVHEDSTQNYLAFFKRVGEWG